MLRTDALITRLAAEGVQTNPAALDNLATQARAQGVSEILVAIMTDATAPIAPRVRAFGRVSSARVRARAGV